MPARVGVSTKVDTYLVEPAAGRVELRFGRCRPWSAQGRKSVSTKVDTYQAWGVPNDGAGPYQP
ncbi:hypothetical protein SRABI102_00703 [Stenotrophomonas lactitubi]|nr:hypothetical protein SRABI102_00703 [Stenotrophomonas lactitubi]CAH0172672.1 hypothetical protein SRABI66_01240 [Stenotrophomonas lactitubi]CAH0264288.1 hypothetical protein SRABI122_03476 [Stenotrophomonas lactitubi]CAH0273610.1 hypothetical protein SRABI81_03784 [Stenotrophomonas lactitubi]